MTEREREPDMERDFDYGQPGSEDVGSETDRELGGTGTDYGTPEGGTLDLGDQDEWSEQSPDEERGL